MNELASPSRILLTVLVLAFVAGAHRALFRGRPEATAAGVFFGAVGLLALAGSHVDAVTRVVIPVFPVGLVAGLALALGSLRSSRLRAAFDDLADGDIRMLMGTRAAFGAFLVALAMMGLVPVAFAATAGIGDVVVGTLAIGAPSRLDRTGSRLVRGLVHGVGLVDLLQVVFLAMTLVRPWVLARGDAPITLALPWLGVPLMVAIDLHGIRKVLASEPLGHGSQSAGGIRRALP